jgi:protein-S-isoprenylcysteine O-methyltransferase Ste14
MTDKNDNPNVIAPPPLIFLSGLISGGIVSWFYPYQMFSRGDSIILGSFIIIPSVAIIALIWRQMKQSKTNIEPWKPTIKILDSGFYKYSRNPIYVAMAVIYFGASILFGSVWSFAFLPIVLLIINNFVILREEKYLESKFGEDYLDYKKRVRRWI